MREYTRAVLEDKESANEELRSANEELQSTNEELQSVNEELETTSEEVQSANEELRTLNEELESASEQRSRANEELRETNERLEQLNLVLESSQERAWHRAGLRSGSGRRRSRAAAGAWAGLSRAFSQRLLLQPVWDPRQRYPGSGLLPA